MALIPTIKEIYKNISDDLKSKLNISDDKLKKVLNALAAVLTGQLKLTYLVLGDIQKNVFPDTADTSENGGTLDRLGSIHLNRIKRPATGGKFFVSVTGVAASVLRAGLTFKSNDDSLNPGQIYVLDSAYNLTGAGDLVEVRSLGGGVEFVQEIGNSFTITEPVIGVEKLVTVSSIVELPLAAESTENYRKAILAAIQLEPQGGAKTDYRLWSADAQGVRNSYPYVKDGEAGTVQVYIEATEADSTDGYGTPTAQLLLDVEEVIEFDPDESKPIEERGRKPIQVTLEILPIIPNPVDVTITGLVDSSVDIQANIENNLKAYLTEIRPFVAGGDLARNKNDILYLARLQSVVTDSLGAANFFLDLTMFVNGVNQTSFIFSRENTPYLRNINFV